MTTAISLFDEGGAPACPSKFNLAAYVLAAGAEQPDKVALTLVRGGQDGDADTLTYGALRARVLRAAGGLLARGVEPGDRVILRIGHSPNFPILFLAIAAIGAVAVPTSTLLSAAEFDHIAAQTKARLLIADRNSALPGRSSIEPEQIDGTAASFADTDAEELAYIVYTSGSSGRPKGVAHAHRAVWARRMMWQGWYGMGRSDVMLHAGAFNWTYTLGAGLMDPWAMGASTLIYAGPRDPGIWPSLAQKYEASIFAAAPGVYRQLLKSGASLDGFADLRHGLSAGETMAAAVRDDWTTRTGKPIYEALGMTEISTFISSAPTVPPRRGCAGRPQVGRRIALLPLDCGTEPVAIGAPGIIAVDRCDPGLMIGYWNDPAGTTAAHRGNWFLTGDLGVMDDDHYIVFQGRSDDQMNALGYRVAPEEVEAAMMQHPQITAAAAVELPVRTDLSVIAVFVTSDTPVDEPTLAAHAKAHLAAYKVPRIFRKLDDLPRNPNGKLRRKDLIATYGYKSEKKSDR